MPSESSNGVRVFYRRSSREEIVRALAASLPELAARVPIRQVVLFGSTATERHTAASDVDVLVIYAGAPRADVFGLVKDVLRIPHLEPHVYTEAEAEALAPVLARMTRGGIRLYPQRAAVQSSTPSARP